MQDTTVDLAAGVQGVGRGHLQAGSRELWSNVQRMAGAAHILLL